MTIDLVTLSLDPTFRESFACIRFHYCILKNLPELYLDYYSFGIFSILICYLLSLNSLLPNFFRINNNYLNYIFSLSRIFYK